MNTNYNELQARVENLVAISKAKVFLSREFLVWLWYVAETKSEGLELKSVHTAGQKKYDVQVWIDDKAVFEALDGNLQVCALKGGDPVSSPEADVALKSGKLLKEVRLGLRVEGVGDYRVVLGGAGLPFKSLVLPQNEDVLEEVSEDDLLIRRLGLMQIFHAVFDSLFKTFLDERISKKWDEEICQNIRDWIAERE
jgi:hypothetical protein